MLKDLFLTVSLWQRGWYKFNNFGSSLPITSPCFLKCFGLVFTNIQMSLRYEHAWQWQYSFVNNANNYQTTHRKLPEYASSHITCNNLKNLHWLFTPISHWSSQRPWTSMCYVSDKQHSLPPLAWSLHTCPFILGTFILPIFEAHHQFDRDMHVKGNLHSLSTFALALLAFLNRLSVTPIL